MGQRENTQVMTMLTTRSWSGVAGLVLLCLEPACSGVQQPVDSGPHIDAPQGEYALTLSPRDGDAPDVPDRVPHQQLDQNSPVDVLDDLDSFLFGLEHVERGQTGNSLASARGAFIAADVTVNSGIDREFTHIHMEPGPGSQHLQLRAADAALVVDNGWGLIHPWSETISGDGQELLMIFAPRDETDLDAVKKIVTAAWHLALSED